MDNRITQMIMGHCKKQGYSPDYAAHWLRNTHCVVCGKLSAAPHHIRSRGAGGSDDSFNLLSLCQEHPLEVHTTGKSSFATKYNLKLDRKKD